MMCFILIVIFFFKQKTAYEMRISDWSSDVCSSDLSDFQINQFRDLGGGRTAIVIGNAATVKTKGVEFEMTTRPVRGLTLAGGIGFLKADYDNLPLDPVTIVSGKLPNAPDAQASGSIEYETAVGSSLQLRSNFTSTYRGNYF